tara:strand:- start:377 stop:496 length:120 start_codon:yes stop_codon:yes gene_type:complete
MKPLKTLSALLLGTVAAIYVSAALGGLLFVACLVLGGDK